MVLEVNDILESLNLFMIPLRMEVQQAVPENAEERDLLALLGHEPIHIDELIINSQLPAPTVTATLTMLELKGLVKVVGSTQFVLARQG